MSVFTFLKKAIAKAKKALGFKAKIPPKEKEVIPIQIRKAPEPEISRPRIEEEELEYKFKFMERGFNLRPPSPEMERTFVVSAVSETEARNLFKAYVESGIEEGVYRWT